ncbi:MAG: hypothetical protein JWP69_166 [Flaviaesturariibacter sp.]|nr:hypothetical protein [Flaviaesturariibacter sp.]
MTSTAYPFNSLLSLKPLVSVLKKMIAEGKPGARQLYQGLLNDIEAKPELLAPMEDADLLMPHNELVETLLSTIFPPSTSANEGMFAVCFPFRSETVFASGPFKQQFHINGDSQIIAPDNKTNFTIAKASLNLAYDLILRKFYGWDLSAIASSVHEFNNPETGLTKYLDLKMNAQFVEVKLINKDFTLPASYEVQRSLDVDDLRDTFPIENFQFEGLIVIDVTDVTSEQVIAEIKNNLLNTSAFSDGTVFDSLQRNIQTFLGAPDVSIGITPFFKINGFYHFSEVHYKHSILFKNERVQANQRGISELSQQLFKDATQPFLFQTVSSQVNSRNDLMTYYYEQGTRSLILCPLKCDDGQLIGLLEICSNEPGRLKYKHLSRIQSAVQVFSLALEKNLESLDLQIDKTIKEHFTSIQPAVEWKFTEAAFDFLQQRQVNESATLPSITFNDVYPLYAAIDIKNSSQERNTSIQKDLLEQLNLAHAVLVKANNRGEFPLLKEIKYKLEKYMAASTDSLLSEDEMMIYEFLQHDLESLFRHLLETRTDLKEPIQTYFDALDKQKGILYRFRKQYEDSVTKINDTLDRFIDREQAQMQHIFPHYFERYVTDGLDFNIYIGQSLAPHQPFNDIYVSNLKMWQLTLLVKAARLTHSLEKRLALPLQTTQLILAHSVPLSISFRQKERKFDVDGAYNIRYEIVKKRIDKVHTAEGERLTQVGKIAIVYSQQKELNEYLEYIEYLQAENLLGSDIEYLELEELQGISGLKGLRLEVLYNHDGPKPELSKVTSKELTHPLSP